MDPFDSYILEVEEVDPHAVSHNSRHDPIQVDDSVFEEEDSLGDHDDNDAMQVDNLMDEQVTERNGQDVERKAAASNNNFAISNNTDNDDPIVVDDNDDGKDDGDQDTRKNNEEEESPQKDSEDDDEVQVLNVAQVERERRRKRRRQLHRMLQKPGAVPSFMAVISGNSSTDNDVIDVDDDDDDECEVLPMVVIDVDKYIGLKDDYFDSPMITSSAPTIVPSTPVSSGSVTSRLRSATATASPPRSSLNMTAITTPAEEGWYEGVRLMALPEDHIYLGEMQQWVRQNLEYFSATKRDVEMSQAGRRTPTVRGKVGIRCIHCAKAVLADSTKPWPPGSVSYPLNFSGLYSVCSQKPQLHFETCPYLPANSKLTTMLQQSRASQLSNTAGATGGSGSKRKRMPQGISALMYYTISCQRIGMVEVSTGIRFGRDLALEPLPFETIKLKVEHEQPQLIPRQYQTAHTVAAATTASRSSSSSGFQPDTPTSRPDRTRSSGPAAPVVADEASKKLLQEALDGIDENDKGSLVRKSDRGLVSDFIFLAICQMAVCHAQQMDFLTRGKKTKLMRLGFAGFCCKHCQSHSSYSCRSFSSVPDNLASAISNSFVLHLQKCSYTPRTVQQAMSSLKRIHTSQMHQLPYGSQRRLFIEMWQRLRQLDKDPSEMPQEPVPPPVAASPEIVSSFSAGAVASPKSRVDPNLVPTRGTGYPVSSDELTLQTLKKSEEEWDTSVNDNLISPEDRNLVSDYVFLTMRQLKVATPTPGDFRGNRRNNILSKMAGMCCIHCAHDPSFTTPSGRSFPSAPDNMASALNSSLYNHMQNCPYLPREFKHAFVHLKKIHSAQCSSLAFGSQRRFFNKVYAKLKQVPVSQDALSRKPIDHAPTTASSSGSSSRRRGSAAPLMADAKILSKHSFVKRKMGVSARLNEVYQCLRCRMVPFDFRTPGAVFFVPPLTGEVEQHYATCQTSGIDLTIVKTEYKKVESEINLLDGGASNAALTRLISSVVGDDDDFTKIFSAPFADDADQISTADAWKRLPSVVDMDKVNLLFESMAQEMGLKSAVLSGNAKWMRYLQLISPGLDFEQESARKGEEHTMVVSDKVAEAVSTDSAVSDVVTAGGTAPSNAAVSEGSDSAAIAENDESQATTRGAVNGVSLPTEEGVTTDFVSEKAQPPTAEQGTVLSATEQTKMAADTNSNLGSAVDPGSVDTCMVESPAAGPRPTEVSVSADSASATRAAIGTVEACASEPAVATENEQSQVAEQVEMQPAAVQTTTPIDNNSNHMSVLDAVSPEAAIAAVPDTATASTDTAASADAELSATLKDREAQPDAGDVETAPAAIGDTRESMPLEDTASSADASGKDPSPIAEHDTSLSAAPAFDVSSTKAPVDVRPLPNEAAPMEIEPASVSEPIGDKEQDVVTESLPDGARPTSQTATIATGGAFFDEMDELMERAEPSTTTVEGETSASMPTAEGATAEVASETIRFQEAEQGTLPQAVPPPAATIDSSSEQGPADLPPMSNAAAPMEVSPAFGAPLGGSQQAFVTESSNEGKVSTEQPAMSATPGGGSDPVEEPMSLVGPSRMTFQAQLDGSAPVADDVHLLLSVASRAMASSNNFNEAPANAPQLSNANTTMEAEPGWLGSSMDGGSRRNHGMEANQDNTVPSNLQPAMHPMEENVAVARPPTESNPGNTENAVNVTTGSFPQLNPDIGAVEKRVTTEDATSASLWEDDDELF